MINNLQKLYKNLKKRGFSKEANFIQFLIKYAGYEDEWRERIETLSRFNKRPFNSWFPEGDRLYLEFQPGSNVDSPIDVEVKEALEGEGYQITDYVGGYCQKDGRKYKIGKVLNKLMKDDLKHISKDYSGDTLSEYLARSNADWKRIINTFLNSEYRTNKKYLNNLMVVISQNPHDVAKMSYERAWKSCMELGEGSHHESVFCEVESGGLVAYLITRDDKNIEKPLARIHIRRFSNSHGVNLAKPEGSVYGNTVPGFAEFVEKICAEKNKQAKEESDAPAEGLYSRKGGEYSDTFDEELIVTPKSKEGLIKWFKEGPPRFVETQWVFEDTFYDELDNIGANYWDAFREQIFFDPEYAGTKHFETKENAEMFKRMVEGYDYEELWFDYLVDDSEKERLDELGILDDKIEEMRNERFTIEEITSDKTSMLKEEALKRLIYDHTGDIDIELGSALLEYMDQQKSMWDKEELERALYKSLPALLSPERFVKNYDIRQQRMLIELYDTLNPEKADELYQAFKDNAKNVLNLDSGIMKKLIEQNVQTALPWTSNTESKSKYATYAVNTVIRGLCKGQIDDELYEYLQKFLFKDLFEMKELTWKNYLGIPQSNHERVLSVAINAASPSNMSKKASLDFAKRMWGYLDMGSWERAESGISVHSWMYFIKELGADGNIFKPMLNDIIENADEDSKMDSRYVAHNNVYSNDSIALEMKENDRKREVSARIRRAKSVLDCIENDIKHSSKYKWHS